MEILKWPGKKFFKGVELSVKEKCNKCGTKIRIDSSMDVIPLGECSYEGFGELNTFSYVCPYCNNLNDIIGFNNNQKINNYFKANGKLKELKELSFLLSGGLNKNPSQIYQALTLSEALRVDTPLYFKVYLEGEYAYIKDAYDNGNLPRVYSEKAWRQFENEFEPDKPVGINGKELEFRSIARFQNKDGHNVYSLLANDGYCYNYVCNNDDRIIERYVRPAIEWNTFYHKR
jgi:hypothetical protein